MALPQLKHNCVNNLRVTGIVRPKEIWTSDETFNIFLTWVTVLLSQLSNQSFPHVYSARLRPISPSVDYLDNRPPINFSRVWFWLIGLSRSATYETLQYYFDHRMGRGGRHNDFACGRKTRVFLFCFNALRWRPRTSVGRTPAGQAAYSIYDDSSPIITTRKEMKLPFQGSPRQDRQQELTFVWVLANELNPRANKTGSCRSRLLKDGGTKCRGIS